jgi:hypothetical protein
MHLTLSSPFLSMNHSWFGNVNLSRIKLLHHQAH